jgi:hypothetical protein
MVRNYAEITVKRRTAGTKKPAGKQDFFKEDILYAGPSLPTLITLTEAGYPAD